MGRGETLLDLTDADVQDALEHLYDYVYLQGHPLAASLAASESTGWNRGGALHRLLVETIDLLKPPTGTPPASQIWRRYRHAFMRYIETATVAQIAEELGVSERQARRDNHEAVQAIVELLRRRLGGGAIRRPPTDLLAERPASPPRSGLAGEAARLGAAEPHVGTSLQEVVDGVLATAANLAGARSVAFDFRALPVSPLVTAERTVVRQVLLSIVVGQVELAAPGERILVSVARGADHAVVAISVPLPADPAAGLARAFQGRLAVARKLTAQLGATLLQERSAEVLRVSLSLPIVHQTTVLLVDDNPGMLRLLRRYLGGSSYAILEATTPDQAIELARRFEPEAITLDVMLPTRDGWEVLQTLRALPATRHIPVVVCSVLRERELALSLGAAAFLAKPITQPALLQALSAVLPLPGR